MTNQASALLRPPDRASYSEDAAHHLTQSEYNLRLEEAKLRVIKVIRFHEVTLPGRGLCHEIRGLKGDPASLARYVNDKDADRSLRAMRQRELTRDLRLLRRKIRMPQNLQRRRSALFGGQDLDPDVFELYENDVSIFEQVERIRANLFVSAVKALIKDGKIEYVKGIWGLKVSAADTQRLAMSGGRRTKPAFHNQRPFHGRPNRDRDRDVW